MTGAKFDIEKCDGTGREALTLEDVIATLNSKEIKERSKAKGDDGEGLYLRGRINCRDLRQSRGKPRSKSRVAGELNASVKEKDNLAQVWHKILGHISEAGLQVLEKQGLFGKKSLALDEGFSSKNYFRKFLRALHPKWRAKVTKIEESKYLSSLALDELIGNLKVHEVVMEKDSKIYKGKKKRVKSIALKAKKKSSDDETSMSRSDDEEYDMALRNLKKFFRRKGKFVRKPREEKKSFRPKPPRNKYQKAFVGGCCSDSENEAEDKINDETCLMAQSSNEGTDPPKRRTDPPYVDPSTRQKVAEHVLRPPMSSQSDFVIVRKKLIHNKIEESKKLSLKPSLKNGLGYVKTESRTDHGSKIDNEVQFRAFCDAQGITHNFLALRTPQSNGVVERKNRTLQEMSRTMLNEQSIP
ncbi:zf-CCHC domain-containing protein [Tanacetum coccineum]